MRFTHQPGAQPLAGYTIDRGIQRGGFGEVYYAHSDGGKEVALKLIQREQEVELRGVRQCLNLKHPNLVNLFDVRTDSHGEQWVVMEYVNGSSLEDVLASFPNGLPIDEVQDWLSGMVAGVSYLHDRGIVHRDLKPANVYRENGTVKIGDVGLSKQLGSDRRATHTQSVGTVYYMAPEVAKGQYGPEVDVYALGIMLYEMLTGQLPFSGDTTAEVLMKHLTATANLNGLQETLRPVVEHALTKDPQKRTSSANQLQQEFREAAGFVKQRLIEAVETGSAERRASLGTTVSVGSGVKVDTATSMPMVGAPPIPIKTSAQVASAYAQYPTEHKGFAAQIPVAATPQTPPNAERKSKRLALAQSPSADPDWNWPLIVAAVVGLGLFAPGSMRSWVGLGLTVSAIGVASILRRRDARPIRVVEGSESPEWDAQFNQASSHASKSIGLAATSLTIGSVSACLISAGLVLTSEFFQRNPRPFTAEFQTLFTATSLVATWVVLLVGQLQQQFKWLEKNPRKTFLALGILVGTIAFGLDRYLLVDYARPTGNYSPAFKSLGVHRLVEADMNPVWLGYAVFFGGLMFWHRWSTDMARGKSRPLSVGRLCTVAIAAWLLTIVFAFPQWPAVLWAITISASVQLAACRSSPGRCTTAGRC